MSKAVFTIATGPAQYLRMAWALARSFRLWNDPATLPFYLVTDAAADTVPADLAWVKRVPIDPGRYGSAFTPKLSLDEFAPAAQSLFVDADCLCTGNLEAAFERFAGHPVSVIGRPISSGEWFGDIASIVSRMGVSAMPRFNGGVYYLERGELSRKIFASARELQSRYDELGFKRLRGHPNDEVLISLAMALHGAAPIEERGDIMNSLMAGPGGFEIDVFRGHALLRNPKDHPAHNPWYHQEELRPRLIHFAGCPIQQHPYRDEVRRLELVHDEGLPLWQARLRVWCGITAPARLKHAFKTSLRPLYRKIFGTRPVKGDARF